MIYLDTSALIKRFVNEKGSPLVQSLLQQPEAVATAKIAYAEVFAGLARKLREGNLPKNLHALACRQFEREWPAYLREGSQEGSAREVRSSFVARYFISAVRRADMRG